MTMTKRNRKPVDRYAPPCSPVKRRRAKTVSKIRKQKQLEVVKKKLHMNEPGSEPGSEPAPTAESPAPPPAPPAAERAEPAEHAEPPAPPVSPAASSSAASDLDHTFAEPHLRELLLVQTPGKPDELTPLALKVHADLQKGQACLVTLSSGRKCSKQCALVLDRGVGDSCAGLVVACETHRHPALSGLYAEIVADAVRRHASAAELAAGSQVGKTRHEAKEVAGCT